MNCATSTLKYIVFVFNVLCAIFGLVTAGLSAWAIYTLHNDDFTSCVFSLVVGLLAFLISFFGCVGAYRESTGFMYTYASFLTILLVVQLAVVLTFHARDFTKFMADLVESHWAEEVKQPGPMAIMEQVDECCGLHSWKDYPAANLTVPIACYPNEDPSNASLIFTDGCLEKITGMAAYFARIVKTTNWILTGIVGTALVFACILAHSFRRYSRMNLHTI